MKREQLLNCLYYCAAVACLGLFTANVVAQSYPNRPIRLIVPFAPGGGVDFIGRAFAQRLAQNLEQPVIIDNRGGAGGIVGRELAARAAPDGYTLIMGNNSTHAVLPAVTAKMPYDSIKDFTPISLIAGTQNLLVANTALPARTVKEFIELARARPGQFNYGSAGEGSQTHLAGELFRHVMDIKMTHIPYNESYFDPARRTSANAVQVWFNDGSSTPKVEIEYPLGHPRRRAESLTALRAKFEGSLARRFPPRHCERILGLCDDGAALGRIPVHRFVDMFLADLPVS